MSQEIAYEALSAATDKNHPKHTEILRFITNHILMPHTSNNQANLQFAEKLVDIITREPLSETTIIDINAELAHDQTDPTHVPYLGRYRTRPFREPVGDAQGTYDMMLTISSDTAALMGWSRTNVIEIYEFFFELLRIHPFVDGNGRTSRLVTAMEMMRIGQVPFMFQTSYDLARFKQAYHDYLLSGYDINHTAEAMAILERSRIMCARSLQTILEQ